ncbi:hypothetical protein JR316_0009732 [Psilocybe cubensis]|uniref:Integral membrane protein n=2 Tax=Psilocybe cubensis TaxID=181762 RepID=A0A8H7XML9_PSICU|nr:hypothetical protein JR316_0009732 [Psilocybe cubensis]KAH9477513.1 hypothetical protein JR316_0009732 [Psilocybe cubensis]
MPSLQHQITDPEKATHTPKAPHHIHIPRWHHTLHPSLTKQAARNALPTGIAHIFHPTHAVFTVAQDGAEQRWFSRWHRKRLYKRPPNQIGSFWARIANMRRLEYWNVSWWVAISFTLGSIVWVINGFAAFLPFTDSSFTKAPNSQGWTAFLGATIFEIGSIFGIWEAWNRDDATHFGWNAKRALFTHKLEKGGGKEGLSESESGSRSPVSMPVSDAEEEDESAPEHRWIWFSTNGKFFRELGFLGAFSQLVAASIFWISGFTAIPNIQEKLMDNQGLNDGIYWTPQVIGGTGFMISGTFIMLEAQKIWWKPNITSLGWHVGFWNFIGAVGFTLSGAFGYAATASSGAEFESALSTFWGGWAFLIGSIVQWYECVNSVS